MVIQCLRPRPLPFLDHEYVNRPGAGVGCDPVEVVSSSREVDEIGSNVASFKTKVALAAIKGDKTLVELPKQFDLHPIQISDWKQQILDGASTVFEGSRKGNEPDVKELHTKIGELSL